MVFKQATYLLIFLLATQYISSLDLKIVDEDYLEIKIGGQKKPLKMLIDPVGHFTYLLKKVETTTSVKQFKTMEFSNNFGTFKGEWESDFVFITPDYEFGFRLHYLKITEKKDCVLDVDGVIGLGYSDAVPEGANIYKVLGSMKDVLDIKKVMTYDKKNKKLVLGKVPAPDSFNPVSFDISQPDEKNPINLVTLNKVGFYPKGSKKPNYIEVNQPAKLGLIPALIAPNGSKDLLTKEILPKLTSKPESIKESENEKKFFNDFYFTNPSKEIKKQGVLLFGKIGYKFDHTWTADEKYSSAIRLGDPIKGANYWYIGIDKLNVNRMDFDFENKKVILYSTTASEIGKTKYPFIFKVLGITTIATIIAIILIRTCCAKKRQKDIKEGEELAYL